MQHKCQLQLESALGLRIWRYTKNDKIKSEVTHSRGKIRKIYSC